MPNFITYDVEYTNVKPYMNMNMNIGSGRMQVSIVEGSKMSRESSRKSLSRRSTA